MGNNTDFSYAELEPQHANQRKTDRQTEVETDGQRERYIHICQFRRKLCCRLLINFLSKCNFSNISVSTGSVLLRSLILIKSDGCKTIRFPFV